jgi:hypothetical protein
MSMSEQGKEEAKGSHGHQQARQAVHVHLHDADLLGVGIPL